MWEKTRGIVLRTVKYKDTAQIATVYTEAAGRMSFRVSLTRSRRAAVKASLFQPLALVELEADLRRTQSVCTLKEAKPFFTFGSLPFHPYKSAMALFLAEVLYGVLREEGENVPLFAYVSNALMWLDRCTGHFSNFHLVFLIRLLRFVGLQPNLEEYAEGDWFDMRAACFTPRRPATHADCLPPHEAARLQTLMRMNFSTMHLFEMSRAERSRCLEVIVDYYRLHLPGFREPRSLEVLRELFSE